MAPKFGAYPSEAGLDLVGDDETTVAADSVDYHGNVPIHEGVYSTDALDGLEKHTGNMACTVRIDNF